MRFVTPASISARTVILDEMSVDEMSVDECRRRNVRRRIVVMQSRKDAITEESHIRRIPSHKNAILTVTLNPEGSMHLRSTNNSRGSGKRRREDEMNGYLSKTIAFSSLRRYTAQVFRELQSTFQLMAWRLIGQVLLD